MTNSRNPKITNAMSARWHEHSSFWMCGPSGRLVSGLIERFGLRWVHHLVAEGGAHWIGAVK
ncbi:hypothetical protein AG1IA_07479 [Rhizoctonia solani AG-1 IA]|uniref:Uncharacterized protein n=1 Tax=Thanatephorus cucumeris (strain AG1-IA) TaxID=983506 RepID=L8WNY9_THACA|nr:hypothetical protein AG1IA_07479 [Rhizoctonia solani AG-1 IA]